jgi:hypothetical protein
MAVGVSWRAADARRRSRGWNAEQLRRRSLRRAFLAASQSGCAIILMRKIIWEKAIMAHIMERADEMVKVVVVDAEFAANVVF